MTIYILHIQNVINASKYPNCSVVNLVGQLLLNPEPVFSLWTTDKKTDALTNCVITQLDDRILDGTQ